ncbi:MAG TPA: tetratricopeptide repeat protein [Candidatus Acidoferrum sp.]|nr:tetratricopeptide repeat protein [Candidatus Acidoferrum sp.]
MALLPSERSIDVGAIVLQRASKSKGSTVSATPYKAPTDARKAYEKGVEAENNGNLANARQYFEKAVQLYPAYAVAWFQLGTVFRGQSHRDEARTAYTKAMTLDPGFMPACLGLASLAAEAENWPEVLKLTGSILQTDPFKNVADYVVELDGFGYGDAYFYNSVANYRLDRIEDAQRSALKVEHRLNRFPQVHLLLANIFFRKNEKAAAIAEMKTYLEVAPHAPDADHVRELLAKLEQSPGSL